MKKQITMEDLMPIFREQLESGKKVQFAPSGISMRPMLEHRVDQVFLEKATKENVKKWDVVLFKGDNGAYVLHRIIKLDAEGFVTRGDNNYYDDKKQSYDALIGRVYRYEHKGKERDVSDFLYKLYVVFWMSSYFVRNILVRIKNKIKRMGKKSV